MGPQGLEAVTSLHGRSLRAFFEVQLVRKPVTGRGGAVTWRLAADRHGGVRRDPADALNREERGWVSLGAVILSARGTARLRLVQSGTENKLS